MKERLLQKVSMEELLNKYEAGERIADIAKEYGCTVQTIYRHLGDHLIKSENNTKQRVIEMYQSGMGVADIAKVLGCSRANVYLHLKDVPKKNKGGKVANTIPAYELHKPCDAVTTLPTAVAIKNEQNACVVLESCDIRLAGSLGTYSINTKAGEIVAMFGEDKVSIPMGMVNAVIEELKAVGRCAMSFDMGNAMW